ncbi:hypothetical protein FBU31_007465, partial [Coemansia sp. 'formosensis']
ISAPHYGFTIMNRLGLENFTEHLTADMSFQTSDQIIMYTSGGGILGVWIYEEADRVRIPEQLGQCCKSVKSAFSGQSPQRLYPKNADEEKEFERLYPRSRSNSRKDGDHQGSALSAIVNHSRQKQKKDPGVVDLASKMQAIGIDFGVEDANARALPSDPAIIMARKSVKPHEMAGDSGQKTQQSQAAQASPVSDSSEFRSPLSVPAVQASSAGHHLGGAPSSAPLPPASPVLHPAPSPFPPSTIATPLPGPQQVGPGVGYAQQQMPQYWYHAQMAGGGPANRASPAPAPPPSFGMVPGMYAFPQLAQQQQPMHVGPAQQQFAPGPMQGLPVSQAPRAPDVGGNASVAHNLAEQLVSL